MQRQVYFVSDSTGLTVERLGRALLTQFPDFEFRTQTLPFIDNRPKAELAADRIRRSLGDGEPPIVLTSIVDPAVREVVDACGGVVLDVLETFIHPLEAALGAKAAPIVGHSHNMSTNGAYARRVDAINYALAHDDGLRPKELEEAAVVLIGVSRSGKTPTSLYLAMQFGIQAANYPLTDDDFERGGLPAQFLAYRAKLFGLTIDPERLAAIRQERYPNSRYASLEVCRREVRQADAIFKRLGVPVLNSTQMSIEELATSILEQAGLRRQA